jgi:hypothetical protein
MQQTPAFKVFSKSSGFESKLRKILNGRNLMLNTDGG